MNLSKLMVLGLLASGGPMHGHRIRLSAERTDVGDWGGVNVGALYREIRRMEADGLVEPVRTEQVGRRPTRTVYRITEAGLKELGVLRAGAIRELWFGPDAFGVALLFGRTWGRAELAGLLQERRRALDEQKAGVEAEGAHLLSIGAIGPLDAALFRRRAMQIDAELRWHDEFERLLDALPGPAPRAIPEAEAPSPPPPRSRRGLSGGTRHGDEA